MNREVIIMIYPEFIQKNDVIGISAPSAGVGRKLESFDMSLDTLHSYGFRTKETASVRVDDMRSNTAKIRGRELTSLFLDDEVKMVMSAAGGDFLNEILPYVDFSAMKNHPKWLMGASDPTGILFPYTVKYDVATIYGMNAGSFDLDPLPPFCKNAIRILQGKNITQRSYDYYMGTPGFLAETVEYDTPVRWEGTVSSLDTTGRCIGGCIDALKDLIGTKYETVRSFVSKYRDDGFIWYFDNFSLSAEVFYRTLVQMGYAGWFKGTRAVIVGRVLFESSETGMTYEEAIRRALPRIPVLYQADIGHTIPNMTMINGALMNVKYNNHKARISFELK